jgi:two-component system sensor histidine kinase BaeS
MSTPTKHLRTRLLVAMVTIALGVLVLTAVVTAGLARRTEANNARDDLHAHAPIIAREFDTLLQSVPNGRVAAQTAVGRRQLKRIRDLVRATLDASNGAVVAINSDGQVEEILGRFLGTDAGSVSLPAGVTAGDLDTGALLAGQTQTGRTGDTVFTAIPLQQVAGVTPVVVVAEAVNTSPFGGNGLAVLGAALLALVIAALVAAYLARRMTRPLAAMETTARAIAGGDLTARVDAAHVPDELGSLASAINAMAADLDEARGHERAFLLSVSHDLRTPLTSIRGYAEAIADGTVQGMDARIRAADVISSESRRLERLVADLLDLARLDAHQFSLHPSPIDAQVVVADAVEAFRPAAAEIGIALVVDRDETSVPAYADPQRLAQIVANLVENALKFAATRVAVSVLATPGAVELRVDDDGPGIAPHDLPRVFERLYTSRTAPGRTMGTGIGLAIVRELARAMGGDAMVVPVDRVGTRFSVTLPTGGQDAGGAIASAVARAEPPDQTNSTSAGGSTSRLT